MPHSNETHSHYKCHINATNKLWYRNNNNLLILPINIIDYLCITLILLICAEKRELSLKSDIFTEHYKRTTALSGHVMIINDDEY